MAGKSWQQAQLGKDEGNYGFGSGRRKLTLPSPGKYSLLNRLHHSNGVAQPDTPNWNPAGSCATSWNRSMCWRSEGVLTMFRQISSRRHFWLIAASCLWPHALHTLQLKSVKIDLPDSTRCSPAVPVRMRSTQLPRLFTRPAWYEPAGVVEASLAAEVNKMINNYKAPVAPEDVATIVDYLTSLKAEIAVRL